MSTIETDGMSSRDKIQNWLMAEGWNLSEQTQSDLAWLIRAEDEGSRRILIGQSKIRPGQIHLEAHVNIAEEQRNRFNKLPEEKKQEILWRLRFRLLGMNIDFAGVGDPMSTVILTQRIYMDGLTNDRFIQRFLTVRNAIIAVIWSIIQDFDGVDAPVEST
jgi:hypothetical protein